MVALLSKRATDAEDAARRAAAELSYDAYEQVAPDVAAGVHALREAGLMDQTMEYEYPIAGSLDTDSLVTGFIELIAASDRAISITYGRLVEHAGIATGRSVRCGLSSTAVGTAPLVRRAARNQM